MPRSVDSTRIREALEEMVRTEGWRIFQAHAIREWKGEGFHSRIGTALKSPDPLAAKVVHETSLSIFRLLQWPADQIVDLKGDPE